MSGEESGFPPDKGGLRGVRGGTGNLIVQGDNLHALKALLPRYAGQVKCIYIDPPYNTGNEGWAYNDNVNSPEIKRWLGEVVGKEGETLDRHDRWLCMMYPRLLLLKQILREDGAIFVSIDDNEVATLRLLMDEIFGQSCFCAQVIVQCNPKGRVLAQEFAKTHEYVLVYSRTSGSANFEMPKSLDDILSDYDEVDSSGRRYRLLELRNTHRQFNKDTRPNLHFPLYANPDNGEVSVESVPASAPIWPNWPDGMLGCWTWEKKKCREDADHLYARNVRGVWKVFRKAYATDDSGEAVTKKPKTIWLDPEIHTEKGQKILDEILGSRIFYAPKAVELVKTCIALSTKSEDIVLDSFGGSGTTGHAVLKQNAEDGGNRRFILVEMDDNIARNVTAERVRRVAQGYTNGKDQTVEGLGGGFQFCTLSKEPLFTAEGQIRSDVTFAQLAEFVWFVETGTGLNLSNPIDRHSRAGGNPDSQKISPLGVERNDGASLINPLDSRLRGNDGFGLSPLLGIHDGRAIYLLYNGILKDKSVAGGNVLTGPVYDILPPHDGPKVIFAAASRLGAARLAREQIVFKQTPYALGI
jgi:site-specific DNA-methyltransferase (adenine-specific)/adenine-specific DNA-methyltransferase